MTMMAPPVPGYCVDAHCACHQPDSPIIERGEHGRPETCCRRCGRRGPVPATIITPMRAVSHADLAARIRATHTAHREILQRFHQVWYECEHSWTFTTFLGVQIMKNPNDLWVYQDLLTEHRPKTIIETGTYTGGSALWFAFLMDVLGIEDGHIYTVDIDDHVAPQVRRLRHPRITFLDGSSTDPALAAAVKETIAYPLLVVLDADHSAAHVKAELDLYAPACRIGDWLVVEDTNIGWAGPDGDRGARGGVEDYFAEHPGEFRQDVVKERYLLSCSPGGWLQRMAECAHDEYR